MADAGQAALERLLRRDRVITGVGLAVLCALAWVYLLRGAGLGMDALETTRFLVFPHEAAASPPMEIAMPGMGSMESAAAPWNPALWALTIAMWWVMMVAMMVPSAAPTILLYMRVRQHAVTRSESAGLASIWAFVAGYLLVWLGFSIAAALLYWTLERAGLVSAAVMGSQSRWLSAAVLAAAGLYQLSTLQNVCLSHCRSPAAFLSRHWRPGFQGAMRLGALHGSYCVGCCWMLMALLFVGGVMNFAWIAGLTLLILAEKVFPGGPWVARASGGVLLIWAAATLIV